MPEGADPSPTSELWHLGLAGHSLTELLSRVAHLASDATDGCDEASVTLNDEAASSASSGALAAVLDGGQRRMGEGPCSSSLGSGTVEEYTAAGVLMARHQLDAEAARTRLEDETREAGGSVQDTARSVLRSIG